MSRWGGVVYMLRKIEKDLNSWLDGNTALFIDGARQTGKTYIIEKFGKEHFGHFLELNLLLKPDAIPLLIQSMDIDRFLLNLSLLLDGDMVPGDTIIFIDEIQQIDVYKREHGIENSSFDLVTLTKALVLDSRYRFAFSGSLLGVSLNGVSSWPSGYMTAFTLFPMDFEEFCIAAGKEKLLAVAKECFDSRVSVPTFVHNRLMEVFASYLLVGGMPKCVETFFETSSWKKVELAQKDVEAYNIRDVSKYASVEDKLPIQAMYKLIPGQLNAKSKRFQVGLLKKKGKPDEVKGTFLWLESAGIAIPVWNVSEPIAPLVASIERNLCKLFLQDTGLLTFYFMDDEFKKKILLGEKSINFGSIYENAVASSLRTHGFGDLYYYNSKKYGEVDFLIEKDGEVIPIEVKSGKDYLRHQALNNMLEVYHSKRAIVFHNGNYETRGHVSYFPIYWAEFITKKGTDLLD